MKKKNTYILIRDLTPPSIVRTVISENMTARFVPPELTACPPHSSIAGTSSVYTSSPSSLMVVFPALPYW